MRRVKLCLSSRLREKYAGITVQNGQSMDMPDVTRKSVADHQREASNIEGRQMMQGPRIPRRNSHRRDTETTWRVSLMLTAKWTKTLTNEPSTVPIATPIAPKRHAR